MSVIGSAMLLSNGFAPTSIPDLTLWLDANTQDLGAVSSWTDKSGGARHVVQATGAQQPICTANQLNGRNGLIFTSAAAKHMASAAFGFTTSSDCTIFAVIKLNALSTSANVILFDGIDATNRQTLVEVLGGHTFAFNTGTTGTGGASDTNTHIHEMQGGTTGNYWIDGVSQFSSTDLGILGIAGITINARYTLGNNPDSTWFEFIYYNRKLVASELSTVKNYLSWKWGIAVI